MKSRGMVGIGNGANVRPRGGEIISIGGELALVRQRLVCHRAGLLVASVASGGPLGARLFDIVKLPWPLAVWRMSRPALPRAMQWELTIMAHMLDFTTGRAAIAYRAEGGVPWHGMGEVLEPGDTLDERLRKGGLTWSALRVPSQYMYNGTLMTAPNSFHMIRSDNGASLAVNSRLYQAHQPHEVVSIFDRFVEVDDRWRVETLGSLKGGKVIWGMARFCEDVKIAGDDHAIYAFMNTSFDGSLATRMSGTTVRAVCWNTVSAGMWEAERDKAYISVRHNVDFSRPDVRNDALDRFAAVISGVQRYKAMGEALAAHRLADHQIEGLFKRLTIDKAANGDAAKEEAPTGRARAAYERLTQALRDTLAEGTPRGTAWLALNSVTRYTDHLRTVRDTEGDGKAGAKFASSMLGSGASLKREAIGILAELAGFEMAA